MHVVLGDEEVKPFVASRRALDWQA
ncbi:MAG: hypothetical protein LBI16_05610 [Burkholderiales bacterium]|nr:hypothetical protein [Burkholderiales bacterium]